MRRSATAVVLAVTAAGGGALIGLSSASASQSWSMAPASLDPTAAVTPSPGHYPHAGRRRHRRGNAVAYGHPDAGVR